MKKVAFAMIAAACAFSFANAQLKPEAGSIGLGFRVNGLANVAFSNWMSAGTSGTSIIDPMNLADGTADGITSINLPQEMMFGRYYLSSSLAIRAGLGINSASSKMNTSDTTMVDSDIDEETAEMTQKTFSFGVSAGVEKHFASAASRLDPYAGAMINYASIGKTTWTQTTTDATDPGSSSDLTYSVAGGSHFSLNLLAGFNYFFSDNFAIGAEMMWGFGSTSTGGDWDLNTSATAGGTTTTSSEGGNAKWSNSGFGVGSTGGVNASIFW